jgi:hypothetical protein
MKVRQFMILLYLILIATLPSLGQDQPIQQSRGPLPSTAASKEEILTNELIRIEMELNRIAQDMDSVDAKMMLGLANRALSDHPKSILEAHELLSAYVATSTVKAFTDPASSALKWESCVKTSKLYLGLLDKVFELIKSRNLRDDRTQAASSVAEEYPQLVQLAFLARMMTESQLRCSELQSKLLKTPDVKQQGLWHGLREAVQNEDRSYLDRLITLLTKSGVSMPQFAARVVLDVQKTNHTAAATVVEGIAIVNLGEDIWKLSEIPGINPEFIRALDCDKKAIQDFIASGSDTALVQIRNCRKSAEGSSILAFDTSSPDQEKSAGVVGKIQPNFRELSQHPDIFHMPSGQLYGDPSNLNKGDSKVGTGPQPVEDKDSTFGATFTAVPQPKIPSWWIRCMCPNDHPDAGMVVNGVRWHAPVLQCPNPELKRYEVK